jgi:hypothetical protein
MRAYVITTGVIFGLLTLMHVWRVWVEGPQLARSPIFIVLTVLSAALCGWAWRLVKTSSRP